MKKTTSISLGRRSFIFDEDAYALIAAFFEKYKKDLCFSENASSSSEIVEDVEMRMADLFAEKLNGREVVDIALAGEVISGMGFQVPDTGSAENTCGASQPQNTGAGHPKKIFRDGDHKKIGGVCAGLAIYLDADVAIMRVIFILALIFGFAGFWIYLVFWLIVPEAKTPFEKCEMNGEPATPENIRKYSCNGTEH